MKKYFIITVDTEGEGGWIYHKGDDIHTNCATYVPRFQQLCEKYGFKPVYLTNYEMINNDDFVLYLKEKQDAKKCEVGIHVHAWNNPPNYELSNYKCDQTFLIEYPLEIMYAKFKTTYDLITKKMGCRPTSHRAGRWVMNDEYFKLLQDFEITVDCSYTPHVDWRNTNGGTIVGPNYRGISSNPVLIDKVLEVPMTIDVKRWNGFNKVKRMIKTFVYGMPIWLRPALTSLDEMKRIVRKYKSSCKYDYVEFMIHSSELMPGGSPYFKDEDAIEQLYQTMDLLFCYAKDNGFVGCTLKEYYEQKD